MNGGGDGSRAILGLALVVGAATLMWLVFTNHIGAGSTPLTTSAPGQQATNASVGQTVTKAAMHVANTGTGGGGGIPA